MRTRTQKLPVVENAIESIINGVTPPWILGIAFLVERYTVSS